MRNQDSLTLGILPEVIGNQTPGTVACMCACLDYNFWSILRGPNGGGNYIWPNKPCQNGINCIWMYLHNIKMAFSGKAIKFIAGYKIMLPKICILGGVVDQFLSFCSLWVSADVCCSHSGLYGAVLFSNKETVCWRSAQPLPLLQLPNTTGAFFTRISFCDSGEIVNHTIPHISWNHT